MLIGKRTVVYLWLYLYACIVYDATTLFTLHRAAPEIIANTQKTNNYPLQAADVYSFALVLWEIISKEVPYEDYFDEHELKRLVCTIQ